MTEPVETMKLVEIGEHDPTKLTKAGSQLEWVLKAQLMSFLKNGQDVIAWSHIDMCKISRCIACHALNIDPIVPEVKH